MQSPIDITLAARPDNNIVRMPVLTFSATPSTFTVENTRNNLKVRTINTWMLTSVSPAATLQEFHSHVPAEHLDRGHRHDAELHFVFKYGTTAYAVAVWVDAGSPNDAIRKVLDKKPRVCETSTPSRESIAITDLILTESRRRHYARYVGSLTTPACDEPVTFFILLDPITATRTQINALNLLGNTGNARPLQRIKFRTP